MTLVPQARLVLNDAMYIKDRLEIEESAIEWRLKWVLAVVLLRTVGHVLDKVDGEEHPGVKREANRLFNEWKTGAQHAIFRDFIEHERNSILKEYSSSMTEGPVPLIAYGQASDGLDVVREFLVEENIYRPIEDGRYGGEDGRDVLDEAISWWMKQLEEIDRCAPESPKK